MKNKFQKISISFFLIVFLLSTFYFLFSINKVLAAEKDGPAINLTCIKGKPDAEQPYPWCKAAESGGIAPIVSQFYKIALGLAGASALGVLIYGSILWTLSGAVSSKQDAKEWISGALWGLALLLGAYLILWTINPQLIELKEPSIPKVTVPAPPKTGGGTVPHVEGIIDGSSKHPMACHIGSDSGGCGAEIVEGNKKLSKDAAINYNALKNEILSECKAKDSTCSIQISNNGTVGGEHLDQCHKEGTSQTGTCADFTVKCSSDSSGCLDAARGVMKGSPYMNDCLDEYKTKTEYSTGGHFHCNF